MQLRPIIVPNKDDPYGLWSIQYTGRDMSEFARLLGPNGLWFDQEYLRNFFTENMGDLNAYQWAKRYPEGISVPVASFDTIQFAMDLAKEMREISITSAAGGRPDFDEYFKNYDNSQLGLRELNLSKRQHPPASGWLRLYAVAIGPSCYVITGGAIKLIVKMNREHLQEQDAKMKAVQAWFKFNDVSDYDSFKDFMTNG